MGTSDSRGMMLPSEDKWTLKKENTVKKMIPMLIFDAQDVAMQIFVIRKKC